MNTTTIAAPIGFDVRRFLPARLAALNSRLTRLVARHYGKGFKLSAAEWRIVAVLGQQGAMSCNAAIAHTTMDKVRVSRAVARLLKAGFITRDADPQDRRRAVLGLTAAGRELFQQVVPLVQQAEAEMMSALSETERDVLSGALAKIEDYLARTGSDPAAEIDEP